MGMQALECYVYKKKDIADDLPGFTKSSQYETIADGLKIKMEYAGVKDKGGAGGEINTNFYTGYLLNKRVEVKLGYFVYIPEYDRRYEVKSIPVKGIKYSVFKLKEVI